MNKGFQFKVRKPRRIDVPTYAPPRKSNTEPPIDLASVSIQGKQPDSQQEWWASQWLDRKRRVYEYQYVVFAGASYFYKIDFLVHTAPLYTMVELLGGHWHTEQLGQDDRLRQLRIENAMRDTAKLPMQFIKEEEMVNRETVEAGLERIFHAT